MSTTTSTLVATSTLVSTATANELLASHAALLARIRQSQRTHRRALRALPSPPHALLRLPLIPSPAPSPPSSPPSSPQLIPVRPPPPARSDLPPPKRARVARYPNYVPEEETIRNDYSQRYVDGGEWPQNWVLGAEPEHRFEEYPKQQRLLALKKASVNAHSLPPSHLPLSALPTLHPCKFDVILIDPPFSSSFTWDDLQSLPVPALAADPSFVFMWVGSGAGEGLERGREVLGKWGYRRCEDVVWVKTNVDNNRGPGTDPPTTSLLTRTKQHCLIGIRGTVRRSTDSWLVHCNVDTDVIIWEGDPTDPTRKPPEMYTLIENFCLGTRRLEIFGRARSSLRRGWVCVLSDGVDPDVGGVGMEGAVRWEKETWEAGIRELAGVGAEISGGGGPPRNVVPSTPEIDALRPKSPLRGGAGGMGNQHQHQHPHQHPHHGGNNNNNNNNNNNMNNNNMNNGMGMGMLPMGLNPNMGMGGMGPMNAGMGMGMGPMNVNVNPAMGMGMSMNPNMGMMGMSGGVPLGIGRGAGVGGGGAGPMVGPGMMGMVGGGMHPMNPMNSMGGMEGMNMNMNMNMNMPHMGGVPIGMGGMGMGMPNPMGMSGMNGMNVNMMGWDTQQMDGMWDGGAEGGDWGQGGYEGY